MSNELVACFVSANGPAMTKGLFLPLLLYCLDLSERVLLFRFAFDPQFDGSRVAFLWLLIWYAQINCDTWFERKGLLSGTRCSVLESQVRA
jgi:hypothetical protein